MSRYGFTAITYDPWQRVIRTKDHSSDNTLCLRDVAKPKQRVLEAPPFRVFGRSILSSHLSYSTVRFSVTLRDTPGAPAPTVMV